MPPQPATEGQTCSSTDTDQAWREFQQRPDPVHAAAEYGDLEAVVGLLDGEGAMWMKEKKGRTRDINALATVEGNKGGWTLIFYAAAGGQPDVIKYLIENGADLMRTDQYKQTCVAYAKGSQARQIIRGEQLKITKTSETLAAVVEVQKRCDEIQESNAKIMEIESKRCRKEEILKRQREEKKASRKRTSDEDDSDEDRTDDTQQAIPGETDVSVSTTRDSEIEAYIVAKLKEEAKSREDLVESLAVARKRVLEASESWDYVQRLMSTYRGRPPSKELVESATDVFLEFSTDVFLEFDAESQKGAHDIDGTVGEFFDAGTRKASALGRVVDMERVVEEEEEEEEDEFKLGECHELEEQVIGFDAGKPQVLDDFNEHGQGAFKGKAGITESDAVLGAACGGQKMRLEQLMSAAQSLGGVEWDDAEAVEFMEKYSSDAERHEILTLEDFLRGFEDLKIKTRIWSLELLVDDVLEKQGSREMAVAEDFIKQLSFGEAQAAARRADRCFKLMSTAVPDKTKKGNEMKSKRKVVDFLALVPKIETQTTHILQFQECLEKSAAALSDAADMSTSFFKRPRSENRLRTASEALKNAKQHLAQSCPPAQLGVARIKLLLDRQKRTSTANTSSTIFIFPSQASTSGENQNRIGTSNVLMLPDDSRLPTCASALSDRTRSEVMDLIAEGQSLLQKLPEVMSAELAETVKSGGSPTAELLRQESTAFEGHSVTINCADVEGHDALANEGAELVGMLPDEELVAPGIRSDSPVATPDLVRRSNSPVSEILRFQSPPFTAGSQGAPSTPGCDAPEHALPSSRDKLDFKILGKLLIMCGVRGVSDSELNEVVVQVTKEGRLPCGEILLDSGAIVVDESLDTPNPFNLAVAYGFLEEHGLEAAILPAVYDKLHIICWARDSKADIERVEEQLEKLAAQLRFYQKASETLQDAGEAFVEGAFTDARTMARESDKLFALSTTHDQLLLCKELATRADYANKRTLKGQAYDNLLKAVELTNHDLFDEAREHVEEAASCFKGIENENHTAEIEQALAQVNFIEEEHFYNKICEQFKPVFKHADQMMRARHFMDGYNEYQTLVQSADEFVSSFPDCNKGCQLVAFLHSRRAIALSSHGHTLGEESGRKWHAQALEAAQYSKALYPTFADAVLYEGIALVGMGKYAEACTGLEIFLSSTNIRYGSGNERKIAMLLALVSAKVKEEHTTSLARAASRQALLSRVSSMSREGAHSDEKMISRTQSKTQEKMISRTQSKTASFDNPLSPIHDNIPLSTSIGSRGGVSRSGGHDVGHLPAIPGASRQSSSNQPSLSTASSAVCVLPHILSAERVRS